MFYYNEGGGGGIYCLWTNYIAVYDGIKIKEYNVRNNPINTKKLFNICTTNLSAQRL